MKKLPEVAYARFAGPEAHAGENRHTVRRHVQHGACNPMEPLLINNIEELHHWNTQWDDLLDRSADNDVQYSFEWYRNWIATFVDSDSLRLTLLHTSGDVHAILPAYKGWYRYHKLKVRAVRSLTNCESTRFDIIGAETTPDQVSRLIRTALEGSGCSFMVLDRVPAESTLMNTVREACATSGYRLIIRKDCVSCLVTAGESFDEYYRSLSGKFRKNVNAAERKATERGKLRLLTPTCEKEVQDLLRRGFRIEESGWKGKEGSAINKNQRSKKFYSHLARDFSAKGWLHLFLLEHDDDDLAFYFCLGRNGVIRALKIGVNEKKAKLGPGMILTKRVLHEMIDQKNMRLWDFCGGESRWKKDWANQREQFYSLFIFPDNLIGNFGYLLATSFTKAHDLLRSARKTFSRLHTKS